MVDARAAGLSVVALTNDLTDFHGPEWVDAQEWLKHFDAVVDASKTGVLKPDPAAYAAGVAATGVAAGEVVYLDDMPVNVAGGMRRRAADHRGPVRRPGRCCRRGPAPAATGGGVTCRWCAST